MMTLEQIKINLSKFATSPKATADQIVALADLILAREEHAEVKLLIDAVNGEISQLPESFMGRIIDRMNKQPLKKECPKKWIVSGEEAIQYSVDASIPDLWSLRGWSIIEATDFESAISKNKACQRLNSVSYQLKLELFGDDSATTSKKTWVAEIVSLDNKWKFKREFLQGQKDYASSNNSGSRGIFSYYNLFTGAIYEVNSHVSWRKSDRYFCRVESGQIVRMSEQDVIEWLKKS